VLVREFWEFLAAGSTMLRVWAELYEELETLYDKNGVKVDLHVLTPGHLAIRLDLAMIIPNFGTVDGLVSNALGRFMFERME